MTWAWSISLPPTSKLVLMALADIADGLGVCWPSHPTLALKCSLTDRTVRRVLSALQAHKLVFIEPRFKPTGSRTSNRYRLAVDIPPDTCVLVTTTEPPIEPSQPPPPAPDRRLAPELTGSGGGGDLFFPKDLTAGQRHVLRERLTVLTPGQAQQILDELAGRVAIAQVKNPIRYCATLIVRMQRGEFESELGLNVADTRRATLGQIEKSATGSGPEPVVLPDRLREAIRRMRTKSYAHSRKCK